MAESTARPQDVGRVHSRRGIPSAESLALLARYRAALRAELGETLTELRPEPGTEGLGLVAKGKPALGDRLRLWDLALKLARELGEGIDLTVSDGGVLPPTPPDATRGRAPKLTRRDKARLG